MEKGKKIKEYKIEGKLDFKKIVEEYSGYIYKIIENTTKIALKEEDIEEIIFILWKNENKLKDENQLSSYVAGIVKNLIKEKARKIKVHLDLNDYENTILDIRKIDMIYEQKEKINIIKNKIKEMKKDDISIFELYYYSSKTIKEISKELNLTEVNIKSRLHRIRKRIKKELKKGGYTYEE